MKMDISNQSIVCICGCMTLMNEGISCSSEPPKIEGGNEEDQRKRHGRRYNKSNSFVKAKWLMTHSYGKVLKIGLKNCPTDV